MKLNKVLHIPYYTAVKTCQPQLTFIVFGKVQKSNALAKKLRFRIRNITRGVGENRTLVQTIFKNTSTNFTRGEGQIRTAV